MATFPLSNILDGTKRLFTKAILQGKKSDGTYEDINSNNNGSLSVAISGSSAFSGAIQKVTTSGSRVQLPSNACREVTLIGISSNTGSIYVGGSNVSSTAYGVELSAKDSITIAVNNSNLIYIDSSVSGEGVSYIII